MAAEQTLSGVTALLRAEMVRTQESQKEQEGILRSSVCIVILNPLVSRRSMLIAI